MKFRRYSLEQGLSQGTIRTIHQDSQGYLWFGTQDGLNRFDGYQFDVFVHDDNNPSSLDSDYIHDIFEDKDNKLWVATRIGLNLYHRDRETYSPIKLFRDPDRTTQVNHIVADDNNTLWLATFAGLFSVNNQNFKVKRYAHQANNSNSPLSNTIYQLMYNNRGTLWLGSENGLSSFNIKTKEFKHWFSRDNDPYQLPGYNISSIVEDQHHNLWIGTYNHGLKKLNLKRNTIKHFEHQPNNSKSIANNRIRALLLDNKQQLWIGTRNGLSIMQLNDQSIENHHHDSTTNSLTDNHIWSLYADDNDSIWLGTGEGISQHVQSSRLFGHRHASANGEGLSHKKVRAIFKDKNNHVWIGTDNGINHYNPLQNKYNYYQHDSEDPNSISAGMISSIFIDKQQRLWAGSYDDGLNLMLENGQFKHYRHQNDNPNSLSHNRIYAIMQDRQGMLWISTLHGLNRFDPDSEQFEHFFHQRQNPNSLPYNGIYTTYLSENDDIWIATRGGGLSRYQPKDNKFTNYVHDKSDPTSLSHNRIFALHQTSKDKLWVATSNGLSLLDIASGKFTRYNKAHGLLNQTVYAVTSDRGGYIWVSTNRGLARFDTVTETFKNYDQQRGLQSNEFNNGAYFKGHDGELFFGGVNGLNRFYPDQINDNLKPPKLTINQFLLANRSPGLRAQNAKSPLVKVVNQSEHIQLNHHSPVFSFQFSALHYINPEKNRYAYLLEGFDQHWTYTDAKNRRATYTNLPAGEYVFKVKAANSDGIWTKQSKSIRLTIHPAPWFTWWAFSLYMLLCSAIIAAFAWQRWQKQHIIKESENRLQLALWSSGNQFWDWDFAKSNLMRSTNDEFTLPTGAIKDVGILRALVHRDDFQQLVATFNAHLQGNSEYFECSYRIKNNHNRWIWLLDRGKVVSRNDKGQPLRAIGTLQDITAIKTAETQLRELNEQLEQRVKDRTEELATTVKSLATTIKELTVTQEQLVEAKKAAALSNLVAGVAHELNTPLGICITSVTTLTNVSQYFFDLQSKNQLTKAEFMRFKQTCQQALALISNNLYRSAEMVQSFKMIAVEQHQDQRSPCELSSLFTCIVNNFATQLKKRNIDVNIFSEKTVTINSYSHSLDVILSQLLTNSMQHGFVQQTTPKGQGKINIIINSQANQVQVKYFDNGNGLNTQNKTQIFEPFYTTNRSAGQIGLGMHIVFNHITQKLKGTINIDETHKHGLAYVINLPYMK